MKRKILALAVTLLFTGSVMAQWFDANGIRYNITSTVEPLTVEVANPNGSIRYTGEISIPETVTNGTHTFTVTGIANACFRYEDLSAISLPSTLKVIGADAFYYARITSVVIPESVQTIGDRAFRYCYSLENIVFPTKCTIGELAFSDTKWLTSQPQGVVYINQYLYAYNGNMPLNTNLEVREGTEVISNSAFWGKMGLSGIKLPSTLTKIENYAFGGTRIADLVIPDQVKYIGESAFKDCIVLKTLKMPAQLEYIGFEAFRGCSQLSETEIPSTLKTLNSYAFAGCASLTKVIFNNGIKTFGQYVFNGCRKLTSVMLPETLEEISPYTFFECSALENIEIPVSVLKINEGAFASCSKLNSINFQNPDCVLGNSLFTYCTSLAGITLPASLKEMPDGLFGYCSKLQTVNFPSSVTVVGNAVFMGCTSLSSVNLPNTLTRLGTSLFEGCTVLVSVNIPENLTVVDNSAFRYCENISGLQLHDKIRTIGDYAFEGCTKLNFEKLPASLQNLGYAALRSCQALTSVEIPAGITSISSLLFEKCNNLAVVKLPENISSIGVSSFGYCYKLTEINLPRKISDIGSSAFQQCYALTKITLPTGLPSINSEVFMNCSTLIDVVIPVSVTTIGSEAFKGCRALTKINVPRNVRFIGNNAFRDCVKLTSINLPYALVPSNYAGSYNLGDAFLANATGLTSIRCEAEKPPVVTNLTFTLLNKNIPVYVPQESLQLYKSTTYWKDFTNITGYMNIFEIDSVKYRIDYTQEYDTIVDIHKNRKKGNVVIPSVLSFGGKNFTPAVVANAAFSDSLSLVSVSLPATVQYIGASAFSNCTNLSTVTCLSNTPPLTGDNPFSNIRPGSVLLVPAESLHTYGTAKYWKDFSTIAVPDAVIEHAGLRYVTSYLNNPESAKVVVGNTINTLKVVVADEVVNNGKTYKVKSIGAHTFRNNKLITSVTLGKNVVSVDEKAFLNCSALDTVIFAETLQHIGSEAFSGCSLLKKLNLPDSLRILGYAAFSNCANLSFVKIPAAIDSIGEGAFFYCTKLNLIHSKIANPSEVGLGNGVFNYTPYNVAKLHVPIGTKSLYQQANQWKLFSNIVEGFAQQLTITNPVVVTNKMFDGTTSATITALGTLDGFSPEHTGKVVVAAVANYNDALPGENKTITVVYSLTQNPDNAYIAPVNHVITNAKISEYVTLEPLVKPQPVCETTNMELNYMIKTGTPLQYKITFDEKTRNAGFSNISFKSLPGNTKSGKLTFLIPANTPFGNYQGVLTMKNELDVESAGYAFSFTVNVSAGRIIKKFNDVLLFDNSDNKFTAFQWYFYGMEVPGATQQFLYFTEAMAGSWSLKLTTAEGETFFTCPRDLGIFPALAKVKISPNPVRIDENAVLNLGGFTSDELKDATFAVYNMQGICMLETSAIHENLKFSFRNAGIYICRLTLTNGTVINTKLLVTH